MQADEDGVVLFVETMLAVSTQTFAATNIDVKR